MTIQTKLFNAETYLARLTDERAHLKNNKSGRLKKQTLNLTINEVRQRILELKKAELSTSLQTRTIIQQPTQSSPLVVDSPLSPVSTEQLPPAGEAGWSIFTKMSWSLLLWLVVILSINKAILKRGKLSGRQ